MNQQPQLPHERLDAWQVARQLVAECHRVATGVRRGHGHTLNQLKRASEGVLLNIAEALATRPGSSISPPAKPGSVMQRSRSS